MPELKQVLVTIISAAGGGALVVIAVIQFAGGLLTKKMLLQEKAHFDKQRQDERLQHTEAMAIQQKETTIDIEKFKADEKAKYDIALEESRLEHKIALADYQNASNIGLEKIKADYEAAISKEQSHYLRFSESQFKLYNTLWLALVDLEFATEQLWEAATIENLENFAVELGNAKIEVRKGALLIEKDHYEQLLTLLVELDIFEEGKSRLIDLRRERSRFGDVSDQKIKDYIHLNGNSRRKYNSLLNELTHEFSLQLRRGDQRVVI